MLKDLIYDPEALKYPREAFEDKDYWDNKMPEEYKTLKWKDVLAKIADGIYEFWDTNKPMLPGYEFEGYYEGPHPLMEGETYLFPYGYGMCDNYQQILERDEKCRKWIEDPNKKFILLLSYISKKNQPSRGGFRYHKNGRYIGDQEISCEYLYDEPKIEGIFIYKLYEIVKEPSEENHEI